MHARTDDLSREGIAFESIGARERERRKRSLASVDVVLPLSHPSAPSTVPPTTVAFVLASGYYTGPADPLVADMSALSATSDGAVWIISGGSVYRYSASEGKFVASSSWTTAPADAFAGILAAVNGSLAYFLASQNGAIVVASYTAGPSGGTTAALAALPNGDVPASVTAGADGTLWAIGAGGTIYSYDLAAAQWSTIDPPPGELVALDVGGATAIYALVVTTAIAVYRYADGSWTDYPIQAPVSYPWIGACSDGSLWLLAGTGLTLVLPDGTSVAKPFMATPPPGGCSAASRYACYGVAQSSSELPTIVYAGYGVTEQPAQSWPAMNVGEQTAYAAINAQLGISDPAGVRGAYANLSAPLSDYYTLVRTMQAPSGVVPSDWTTVQTQIEDELEYAQAVQNFFSNMTTLNLQISSVQLAEYAQVVQTVGLPDNPDQQPQTLVSIVLGVLVSKFFDYAVSQVPADVQNVISVGQSIYNFAANAEAKKNNAPNKDVALQLACAALAGTLADMQIAAATATATFETSILADWGMLQACGLAITSDVWYWPPKFDPAVLKSVGPANALDFYQTLMPVKWQLMQLETVAYSGTGGEPWPPHVPGYAILGQYESSGGNAIGWWWVCTDQGTSPSVFTTGPFPNQNLVEAVVGLSTPRDFFTNGNGWNLPVVQMNGYTAAPVNVPWLAWDDSSSPLGG